MKQARYYSFQWPTFWPAQLCLVLLSLSGFTKGLAQSSQLTLQYWHAYSGMIGELHEAFVQEFNATQPDIEIQLVYGGNLWTMRDKLNAALVTGSGPDIASIDQFWIAQLAEGGHVDPLDELAHHEVDLRLDDVLPQFLETVRFEGRLYAIPFAVSSQVLYFNRNLLSEIGLSEKDIPRSWSELVALAERVPFDMNGDGRQDLWILGMPTTAQGGVVYNFIITLWQHGAELFEPNLSSVAFASSEGIEALRMWQELVNSETLDLNIPSQAWESGRLLFQIASSAHLTASYMDLPFNVGVAPLPWANYRATGIGGRSLAVFTRDAERQKAALKFIQWITTADINRRWSMATGYSPLRQKSFSAEEYQALLISEPGLEVALGELMYARLRPNHAVYGDVSRVLGEAVEHALYHGLDPEVALDRAANEANVILQSYQKRLR
jgi:ABC-type glycerol-3-phosphate transport system substrate-binding protein